MWVELHLQWITYTVSVMKVSKLHKKLQISYCHEVINIFSANLHIY